MLKLSEGFIRGDVSYFFRAWVDYLFRRRLPGMWLLHIAALLFLALLALFAFDVTIPTKNGPFHFAFTTEGTPNWLTIGVFAVATMLIIVGIIWTERELRAQSKKRVIVIELRGLRDTSGCPLLEAVPGRLVGRREQLLKDLRQGQDGKISDPKAALRRLETLPSDIATREAGLNRDDISFVIGGLAPVPLSFLTGVLTDDECAVTLMDWNRHREVWSELDAQDDGKRFMIDGLDVVGPVTDVALAVSVSYAVDLAGVSQKLPGIPLVSLKLEDGGPDAHWAVEKQIALGQQFLETLIAIVNRGVKTVHLFLAAPNSVVLRFGRLYDKRNLPALIVYQYERQETPPYPWGIRMPVAGKPEAELVIQSGLKSSFKTNHFPTAPLS